MKSVIKENIRGNVSAFISKHEMIVNSVSKFERFGGLYEGKTDEFMDVKAVPVQNLMKGIFSQTYKANIV